MQPLPCDHVSWVVTAHVSMLDMKILPCVWATDEYDKSDIRRLSCRLDRGLSI